MSHRDMQTAAVPEQMRAMQSLGFEAQSTEDHRFAEWAGYGLMLSLPSDMKMNVREAMAAALGAAKKAGVDEARAEMRKVLGIR